MPEFSVDGARDHCIICRELLSWGHHTVEWTQVFRALYRSPEGVPKLTGVGLREVNCALIRAPNNEDARWETLGKHFCEATQTVSSRCRSYWPCSNARRGPLFVTFLANSPPDPFYFHEECWDRVMGHFHRGEFDLGRFYEAMEYFPVPEGSYSPWTKPFAKCLNYCSGFMPLCLHRCIFLKLERINLTLAILYLEHWDIRFPHPCLEQLMDSPKDIPRQATKRLSVHHNSTDCFARLPIEICEMIAVYLTTPDFLNLRTVSRAIGSVFESNVFWRSRFEDVNSERGFINLLIQDFPKEGRPIDWRLLYHCTAVIKCSRAFDSTIRVWESFRWLRDATVAKPQEGVSHFSGRALQHYHNTRFINTRIERVYLDSSLTKIAISAVKRLEDHAVYITGMEFIYDGCRPPTRIGYTTAGAIDISKEYLEPQSASPDPVEDHVHSHLGYVYEDPGVKVTLDARSLTGFHVDLGPDGVYAISLIRNDRCSSYVGDNHGYSSYSAFDEQTHHLQLLEVREVIVTLGYYRILDLGIRGVGLKHDQRI